jgi:hypothetical protein
MIYPGTKGYEDEVKGEMMGGKRRDWRLVVHQIV